MAKAQSVVDEIASSFVPARTGYRPWYERVNAEQAEMIATILEGWRSGRFGKSRNAAARTISAYLGRHGIVIGRQGVSAWLAKNSGP